MEKIIIGLTGSLCSGKGTLAKHLIDLGFHHQVLSDRIREEALLRGQKIDRTILQDIGNELRENFGGAVLVKRTAKLISNIEGNIVIDGFRNPEEINYLYNILEGCVIGVDAPKEKRLEWYLCRAKERREDGNTKEEFTKHDNRDFGIGEPGTGQQVGKCLESADIVIWNSGSKVDLFRECDKFLKDVYCFDPESRLRPQEKK